MRQIPLSVLPDQIKPDYDLIRKLSGLRNGRIQYAHPAQTFGKSGSVAHNRDHVDRPSIKIEGSSGSPVRVLALLPRIEGPQSQN